MFILIKSLEEKKWANLREKKGNKIKKYHCSGLMSNAPHRHSSLNMLSSVRGFFRKVMEPLELCKRKCITGSRFWEFITIPYFQFVLCFLHVDGNVISQLPVLATYFTAIIDYPLGMICQVNSPLSVALIMVLYPSNKSNCYNLYSTKSPLKNIN